MKSYFSSKTMWFNFAAALLGLIQPIITEAPWESGTAGYIVTGFAVANMVLRQFTNQAVGMRSEG